MIHSNDVHLVPIFIERLLKLFRTDTLRFLFNPMKKILPEREWERCYSHREMRFGRRKPDDPLKRVFYIRIRIYMYTSALKRLDRRLYFLASFSDITVPSIDRSLPVEGRLVVRFDLRRIVSGKKFILR